MNIFSAVKYIYQKKKEKRNSQCDELLTKFSHAVNEAYSYTASKNEYVDIGLSDIWNQKYSELIRSTSDSELKKIRKASSFHELKDKMELARSLSGTLRSILEQHNNSVANAQINAAYTLIGNVEGRKLDLQQMLAIVKDAHNHLIIAGAGTGKTTTVIGKTKYLLRSGKYKPEDILILSFTNASASEMSERIEKEIGCKIAVSTFHKLGLNIISKADGKKPKISQINLGSFIREKLQDLMRNPEYVHALNLYLINNRVLAKSEFEFTNELEYREYLQLNPPVTIQNEPVKRYGEMDIANFLFQNSIKYIYEAEYKVDTRTSEFGQYRPDFYLPDYNIYIENFGINKNGEAPTWFSGKNGKSASDTYHESMEWKRNVHKENDTILIECYSYEKFDGTLLDNLKKHLQEYGVALSPKSSEELWLIVSKEKNNILDGLIELFETVINLIKSNNYNIESLRAVASNSPNAVRYLNLIFLIEPLFKETLI